MKIINVNKGFTLIELLIVITIIGLLMLMSYAPYNYYTKKSQLRLSVKEVAKVLYETRNLAIHGLQSGTGNISVGVYFDKSIGNDIKIISYPSSYDFNQVNIDFTNPDIKVYKELTLQANVLIDSIGGKDNGLFFFKAISGEDEFSYYTPDKNIFSRSKIPIKLSYGGAGIIKGEVTYITETNIVDY